MMEVIGSKCVQDIFGVKRVTLQDIIDRGLFMPTQRGCGQGKRHRFNKFCVIRLSFFYKMVELGFKRKNASIACYALGDPADFPRNPSFLVVNFTKDSSCIGASLIPHIIQPYGGGSVFILDASALIADIEEKFEKALRR